MTFHKPGLVPLIDLDLLRTLVAIAETGNFSAAGEAVGRTPSAISMQVKRMEEIVRCPVFVRDSRSVELTRAGGMLLEHARRMLALNRDMAARLIEPELSGEVRLGAPDDVAERFLPHMLRQFADTCPGITLNVTIDATDRMMPMVDDGKLDIAIITAEAGFRGDDRAEVVYREDMIWAMLAGGVAVEQHPLPVAVWDEFCTWRKAALEELDARKRAYRIAFQSSNITGQRAGMLADLAVAVVPASTLGGSIVEVHPRYDLPPLPQYALGMMVVREPSDPVRVAADYVRRSFARR